MADLTYKIVEHDGGWAYQSSGTFSETFPTHEAARAAAVAAAHEQRVPDQTSWISYETTGGEWITERADGNDRPDVTVEG